MEKEVKGTPDPKQNQSETTPDKDVVVTEAKHSNNKVLIIILVVIGVFVVLGILGSILLGTVFKKAGESIIENATDTSITTGSNGEMTIKSNDDTSTTSTEQKLPDDFPTTIPLYANQKITSSFKQKNSSRNYWQIATETSDAISKVESNVKEAYSRSPWKTDAEVEVDGTFALSYSKTGYKVTISISESSDMKMTNLIYTVEEVKETETE